MLDMKGSYTVVQGKGGGQEDVSGLPRTGRERLKTNGDKEKVRVGEDS